MLDVQAALREAGFASEIFAEFSKGGYEGKAHTHTDYGHGVVARDDDVLLYQMAIGSNVADYLMDLRQQLIVVYHNITPVEFYEPWDPGVTYGMAWGRDQLRRLATHAVGGLAVSEYNRRELEALHYKRTATIPFLIDLAEFDHSMDEDFAANMQAEKASGGVDWLFVGWVAPHKCQHDIIKAFAAYKALYDRDARLHFVGRTGLDAYQVACEKFVGELGLGESVHFHGRVADGVLGAFYQNADVLVSMSEHEGVGIPLLEAMHHRLPIVAYSAAAVPETVGNAGIVLARKRPVVVAAAVARIVRDTTLRNVLTDRGSRRVERYALDQARSVLVDAVTKLLLPRR